jgi:hypothetical protein
MTRNPKPFLVEFKKPRAPGQRSKLSSTRLFAAAVAEATKVFQTEDLQAVAQPSAAPRILPSIIGSAWNNSASIVKDESVQPSVLTETLTQVDVGDAIEAGAAPVRDRRLLQTERKPTSARKGRRTVPERTELPVHFEPVLPLEQAFTAEAAPSLSGKEPYRARKRRLTKRQIRAASLPRHERWKRRLPATAR